MVVKVKKSKPDRGHVDPVDEVVLRHLMKLSGKRKKEIVLVIEKVGTNIETIKRELGC
jgi:hypothetical protein